MEKPFIVKNVRDKVRNTLDILQDPYEDHIETNRSWKDELNGDSNEEESLSESSVDAAIDSYAAMDSYSYGSEEFEEISDDNLSLIEESKIFKEVTLHSEMTVIVPEEDEKRYQSNKIKCVRWTAEDRKKNQLPLTEDDFEITDIYRTAGLFTATEISIAVKVNLPKTHISHHAVSEYFLLLETDDGTWLTLPSILINPDKTTMTKLPDYIEISSICAIARRKREKLTVTEDGFEFVSSLDSKLKLDFPMGAVENKTDIEIQIIPIDQERVRELKEYNPRLFNIIYNMSDVLSVKYEHTKDFNRNVKIQLPVSLTTPNDDVLQPLFIRWNGNQPEILNEILSEVEPGVYSTAVSHFSDVVLVEANTKAHKEDILYITDILSGKSEYCNILTFYTFGVLGTQPSLWVELVLSNNKNEIRTKREAEGLKELPHSYSPDMRIKNQERVHVALKHNIEFPTGICKSKFYLKFDKFCQSNHFIFPIIKKSRMYSPHYVAIEYEFAKSKEIHPVHFDPETMKKNMLVPPKNKPQDSYVRPNDDRKNIQRQNTVFDIEKSGRKIAWPEKPPNKTKKNQGHAHGYTNVQHRQKTTVSGNNTLPPLRKHTVSVQDLTKPDPAHSNTIPLYRQMTEFPSNILQPPPPLPPLSKTFHFSQNKKSQIQEQCSENNQQVNRTRTDAFEDPMFSEESMMMLAKTYGNDTGKEIAICLGFSYEEIKIISDKTNGFDANFAILIKWLQKTKSNFQERYGLLQKAFQSIERGDLVELIDRVRLENRAFTNRDKP